MDQSRSIDTSSMVVDPKSGLSLPAEVLEGTLVREAWLFDRIKRLRRVQADLAEDDIQLALHCTKCDQFVQFRENVDTGEPEMVCACKRRVVV